VLVVEGTLDQGEDDEADAFGDKGEGDVLNGWMFDDVLCSTEIDVDVRVVNGSELDGLEEDLGVIVGVAEVEDRRWLKSFTYHGCLSITNSRGIGRILAASCVADAAGGAPS